ncbi:hypothetical protein TgHK011_001565 [Trichoderma gracile]|nr:hypothetical protein TgHK011_001565 [Trichoderma gracile]
MIDPRFGCYGYIEEVEENWQAISSKRFFITTTSFNAICIDQANKKERSHQVAHMSEIYRQADSVIFFLGRATYQTDAFMEYMSYVQEERNKHAYRSWNRDDKRWSLLNRSWFLRVWILQEVANAKSAVVYCGKKNIPANVFSIAPIIFDVKPSKHCQSVIDIMPGPWRKTSWWSKSPCLYTLLLNFGGSQATESRDLIYALKGIATDKESSILTPDYDKSEECLVRDVVRFLFNFDYDTKMDWNMLATIRDAINNLGTIKDRIFKERVMAGEANLLEKNDKIGQMMKLLMRHRPERCGIIKARKIMPELQKLPPGTRSRASDSYSGSLFEASG